MTRYTMTEATVAAVRAMLAEADPDADEQTIADVLEGETDAFEVIGRLLRRIAEDEAAQAACMELRDTYSCRAARFKGAVEAKRSVIAHIMAAADVPTLKHPFATISMRAAKPARKVINPDMLPAEYRRVVTTWKPDMDAINAAPVPPPGVETTNGAPVLTIRRK